MPVITPEDKLRVAERSLEIIRDPKHWTRNTCARTKDSKPVDSHSPHAVRFCAWGAAQRAAHDLAIGPFEKLDAVDSVLATLADCIQEQTGKRMPVAAANDRAIKDGGIGHKGIVKAYECAIEKFRGAKR